MFEDLIDDTGRFMAETMDRMLETHCTAAVRHAADGGTWPQAVWDAVTGAGFDRATLSEAQGGVGLTLAEALPLVAVASRHAAPVPLAEVLVAGHLLGSAGLAAPEGLVTVAAGADATLTPNGAGWVLTATLASVPWGARADHLVLAARSPDGEKLCLVSRQDWQAEPGRNLANEPRDRLVIDAALDPARIVPMPDGADTIFRLMALARAVQIAGALARVRDMTIAYAQERVQFGRPLGKFQAIQQTIAVLASDAAAAEAAAGIGLKCPGDPLAVAVAKARAGEAAGRAAGIAHQVHGAMGFTQEHPLHFLTRRIWAWRDECGNERHWSTVLGGALLMHEPDTLWHALTDIGNQAA
ncbi:acyl-CoA dehydrogenase family protein [Hoeflea olei]|uniref:Acyl-CoA dehydrogenase/oxidase C-terminal domain-containing protein n=1 Tax=Hoeflea olei TaxID=1480615 RepID=A0A1C1YYI7_9HYPH|nr:acyl-CoA dehydrogenase family protein [Hoeflea olei]OCW58527.1 hypothetical protein AWJ14_18735 [Hoeflea olei]